MNKDSGPGNGTATFILYKTKNVIYSYPQTPGLE